jgi:hypothetical protein
MALQGSYGPQKLSHTDAVHSSIVHIRELTARITNADSTQGICTNVCSVAKFTLLVGVSDSCTLVTACEYNAALAEADPCCPASFRISQHA